MSGDLEKSNTQHWYFSKNSKKIMMCVWIFLYFFFLFHVNPWLIHTWIFKSDCKVKQKRLREFCQENSLIIANTLFQQHKRWLNTWTSPDTQYWNQTDYHLCSQRRSSSMQSAKTWPGADCGSDYELIAKFRLKLKKVGKTTRPFIQVWPKSNLLWLHSGSDK